MKVMNTNVALIIISKLLETIDVSLYRRLFITFSYVTEFCLLDVLVRHVFVLFIINALFLSYCT